jgi:hypothetical protein
MVCVKRIRTGKLMRVQSLAGFCSISVGSVTYQFLPDPSHTNTCRIRPIITPLLDGIVEFNRIVVITEALYVCRTHQHTGSVVFIPPPLVGWIL